MRTHNPFCNYIGFDRKYGYYIQNTPCTTAARASLGSEAMLDERIWRRNMPCQSYAAGYVHGRRQGGRQSFSPICIGEIANASLCL